MTIDEALMLFLTAFLSNAIPFIGVAYTAMAASILAIEGLRPIGLLETAFLISTAATIGKIVVYTLGYGLRAHLRSSPFLSLMNRLGPKGIWLTIALTSFIPGLPIDDYVLIVLGALKIDPLRVCLFVFIGKFFKSLVELPIGALALNPLVRPLGESVGTTWTSLAIGVIASILAYPVYKVDWSAFLKRLYKSRSR